MTISAETNGVSLAELNRRGSVDRTEMSKYGIRNLLSTATKLYDQADLEYKTGHLDNAYVYYMKGGSIVIEVINKHPQYKEIKNSPLYKQLLTRTSNEYIERLERIRKILEQQEKNEIEEVMSKYPPVSALDSPPLDVFDSMPSVPTHIPTHKTQPTLPNPPTSPPEKPIVYMKMPEPTYPTGLQIPPPTAFNFPPIVMVEPFELATWLVKKKDKVQPNVLLIDVRPRESHDQGCIKHTWITQIEPLTLKQNISAVKIEERMYGNPEAEQELFKSRDRFDLVVYYDQNSTSHTATLTYLREAIYEMEFTKVLKRAPMMLKGGFEGWKSIIGPVGIYRHATQAMPETLNPVKMHHTFYDYFLDGTTKPQQSMIVVERPPLQGIFGNTLGSQHPPHQMPLARKKTFIDNPFHGFTGTTHPEFKPAPVLKPFKASPVGNNLGTTGLKNLGNTCYMNSILQCLSGTVPFARYFQTGIFRQHINRENFLGTGGVVAESFGEIIKTLWSGHYNVASPMLFRQAIIEFAPQFKGGEQHDSQEFLTFMLDGIHEDCNQVRERPGPVEDDFEGVEDWKASWMAWERYLERNSSVVVSLFQGQYKSQLRCLTCDATSTTFNAFMSLSLPIPASRQGPATVSLYDCLDYFVKQEILDEDNAWKCPKCDALRKASKSLTISRLPDVLLIHLKRFSYTGPFKDKLETFVDSPLTNLDLTRYVPSSMFPPNQIPDSSAFQYNLYAVSNHFGSLTGGHYTACVRNGYKNEWHNFDDSRVSVCEESKVMTKAAYNLFYVRSTVK